MHSCQSATSTISLLVPVFVVFVSVLLCAQNSAGYLILVENGAGNQALHGAPATLVDPQQAAQGAPVAALLPLRALRANYNLYNSELDELLSALEEKNSAETGRLKRQSYYDHIRFG